MVDGPGIVGVELYRLVVILDCAVVLALCAVGVAAVVIGDDQALRGLRARIDEGSAPLDLKFGRRALRGVAQFNILKQLRSLCRAHSPEQQQHQRGCRAAENLGTNDTKVDSFTVTALGGTTKQISFTIHGADDAPAQQRGSDGLLYPE